MVALACLRPAAAAARDGAIPRHPNAQTSHALVSGEPVSSERVSSEMNWKLLIEMR
jgi:hypothetical protein